MGKIKISKQDVIDIIKKRWWVMLIEFVVLGIVLVADLVSKEYVSKFLQGIDGLNYTLIDGFLDLTYSENTGAGFGIFKDNTTALIVVTAIVMAGILVYLIMAQKQNEFLRVSLIFVLGGGIGNLVDRIALQHVRDFFEFTFMDFAIFNVADVFVVIGAFMLIIVLIIMLVQEGKANKKKFEEEQAALANVDTSQNVAEAVQDNQAEQVEQDGAVTDKTQTEVVAEQQSATFTVEETEKSTNVVEEIEE